MNETSREQIEKSCRNIAAQCVELSRRCSSVIAAANHEASQCGFQVLTPAERLAIGGLATMLESLANNSGERIDTLDAVRIMLEQRAAK